MKVLHLINTLSTGGAEMHLLTLCRYLKRLKVDVAVAYLREQVKESRSLKPDFERAKIRLIHLRADGRYDSLFVARLISLLHAERPDVLHSHLPRADVAAGLATRFHSNLRWVSSVHAIYSEDWSGRWSLPIVSLLWRRADALLCISHAVKDWLVSRGMPPEKTRVIHYGIEPEKFSASKNNLRDQWGLGERAVIGSIGRLEPRKNHECLIAAMPQICQLVPNALLLIAGHDPWGYGATLQGQIDDLGLGASVRLVGFQNDVASFLDALDVFAFATKSEGFGQVVIEAMAARKAVVTSKIPPLTEIVIDGETGLLVESGSPNAFADALTCVLLEPVERDRMAARGREQVIQFFTAERMTQETMALYEGVMGRKAPIEIDPIKYSGVIR